MVNTRADYEFNAIGRGATGCNRQRRGHVSYTPGAGTLLPVGTQTLSVTFTPSNATAYSSASASVKITVNPASGGGTSSTPAITWPTPAAITYPAPLSTTQLDATANVAGTFTYDPPAGSVLVPGTHTLAATFTPSDTAEYTTANATVSITVNASAGTTEFMYSEETPLSLPTLSPKSQYLTQV